MSDKTVKTNKIGNGAIRVTLPKALIESLGIIEGTVLTVRKRGDEIIFRKVKE